MKRTGMTNPRVVDFNADLMRSRWGDLNILDREIFTSFPSYRGLLRIGQMSFFCGWREREEGG